MREEHGFGDCKGCGNRGYLPVRHPQWDHFEENRAFINWHLENCFTETQREQGVSMLERFAGTRTVRETV